MHAHIESDKDYGAARRQYLELYGSTAVMNSYLKIALFCESLVLVGLIVLNIRTYRTFENFKPLVIRISDSGRAEAVNYDSLTYQPREQELKYFLTQFVEKHYSRQRATLKDDYARSLYFLETPLAEALIEANKKSKTIEGFLTGQGEEIDVTVKSVSIEDLRQAPYRATVEFEKVYYSSAHLETHRERYIGHFVFLMNDHVPNALIPVNPLGLTILYFREDQAF